MNTRTVIGLEIHVQLRTKTKIFCGCPVTFDAPPNSNVCPVCLGYPGSLPVINRKAVEYTILTGLALNCAIADRTKWDRKSYFYPDLPKNYQISQYDLPLAERGHFEIPAGGGMKHIRIRRVHLEEDAGKNMHDTTGCTLVDLNRAGTALMEIVTEPDLSSAEEAYTFCTELQRLVTYLGVSEGAMKKGQMRFEPNVNVVIESDGREFRTPISEIKNLNSFRAVRDSIAWETERQTAAWQEDHGYLFGEKPNENRGWNAERNATEFQREKEGAHDYRYFPDPDLVAVEITRAMLQGIRELLPELPLARRLRLQREYNLSADDAGTIVSERRTADLFERVIAAGGPQEIASKQFVNVWLKIAKDHNVSVSDLGVDADWMAELAAMVAEGAINRTAANRLAVTVLDRDLLDKPSQPRRDRTEASTPPEPRASARATTRFPIPSPMELAKKLGLLQMRDLAEIETWVGQAFAANDKAVKDALDNPKKASAAAGFLRGQVMKLSGGKADPKLAGQLIERRLRSLGAN